MVLAVPAPANGVAGGDITAAFWNAQVRGAVNFLANPPLCSVVQTVTQSIPNNAFTAVLFDTNVGDTYSGHSTTTNTSRYVAQVAGWDQVTGQIALPTTSPGVRGARTPKTGRAVAGSPAQVAPGVKAGVAATLPKQIFLNVGDYVELAAYQTSGAAQSTAVFSDLCCSMEIRWVHM